MAAISKTIQVLAKQFSLTNLEEEEKYILTKEEEDSAIENAIIGKKKHFAYKMHKKGLSEPQILLKISEIKWEDEINVSEILIFANSCKANNLWHHEQRRKEKELEENAAAELKNRCDAKYMFRLMKWTSFNTYGKELIVNEANKKLITALCFFISQDKRLESELGFSPNKGIYIRGISGIGKTHLVRCLEENELNPIKTFSMLEITDEIKQSGEFAIAMGKKKVIYLDDVGTEEATVNHYGTKINFFKNFIEQVYLKNKIFNKLIVSTNNSFAEIEEKYSFRVRSRIKEMFNVIDVEGEDMRK